MLMHVRLNCFAIPWCAMCPQRKHRLELSGWQPYSFHLVFALQGILTMTRQDPQDKGTYCTKQSMFVCVVSQGYGEPMTSKVSASPKAGEDRFVKDSDLANLRRSHRTRTLSMDKVEQWDGDGADNSTPAWMVTVGNFVTYFNQSTAAIYPHVLPTVSKSHTIRIQGSSLDGLKCSLNCLFWESHGRINASFTYSHNA